MDYLIKQAGFTTSGVFTLSLNQKGYASAYDKNPRYSAASLSGALQRFSENDLSKKGKATSEPDRPLASREYISYLDDSPLTPLLRSDYNLPFLQRFLQYQGLGLTLWPQFEKVPGVMAKERFVCALDGIEEYRVVSPAFKQNLYTGVYDDLHPTELPEDIEFFAVNATKYPLMAEI
mmetsp:Transcript_36403/g.44488  ORF Transcript_36403/g.44488 Transcript_36403/m.44488 type:complete len:177 (+) Transcript_36403:335-865(+)|eukprot:CAMPEP_0170471002 /NCGR_PEP_ID=MMETSP0123-20130129/13313_1 /TAXON_ID=182087 /ORGANISM="Favella ehrenbergii, Strain Fehren 1" /LENGTH=176 /DNA_ID=CAMNT_0010738397 /DNA_START=330 /DNA_END=860 /DNA_ORIENTATION=+